MGHGRGDWGMRWRLMQKVGYRVTKEYYVNDGGAITLAKSTYLRYLEALGEDIGEIPHRDCILETT